MKNNTVVEDVLNPVAQIAKDMFGLDNVERIELESFEPKLVELLHGTPAIVTIEYKFRILPKNDGVYGPVINVRTPG